MPRRDDEDDLTKEERLAAEWALLAAGTETFTVESSVLNPEEIASLLGFDPPPSPEQAMAELVARLADPTPASGETGDRPYGAFEPDDAMRRFFDDPAGENVLADIRALNAAQGAAPIIVPGGVELMNFSKCPACGRLHSAPELTARYARPPPRPGVELRAQLRTDTCVTCLECGRRFQPTLVIIDRTPKAERQFLCRVQTVEAVERYYRQRFRRAALGADPANRIRLDGGRVGLRNDVAAADLADRPTLLSNMLQYTPAGLALRILTGDNLKDGDLLFGQSWPE